MPGLQLPNRQSKTSATMSRIRYCATRDQAPKPLNAITIPAAPPATTDTLDLIDKPLKSMARRSSADWTIDSPSKGRLNDITESNCPASGA